MIKPVDVLGVHSSELVLISDATEEPVACRRLPLLLGRPEDERSALISISPLRSTIAWLQRRLVDGIHSHCTHLLSSKYGNGF
jgi:hypothetical protein